MYNSKYENSEGFDEMYKLRDQEGAKFADLLNEVANIAPEVRFRFTSPHPKNFPLHLLQVIKENPNICKSIHLPAQSGNTQVLERMRRNYSRDAYIDLVNTIRSVIPEVSLSTDMICGFCGESDEEFEDTLTLIGKVKYDFGFLFAYSMRERTHAHRRMEDDVPEEVKGERLKEMIRVFRENQLIKNNEEIGRKHLVLVDQIGKYEGQLKGKSDTFKNVIFDDKEIEDFNGSRGNVGIGEYAIVEVTSCNANTLFGEVVKKCDFNDFFEISNGKPFF